ncbi:substrate-binding domain-containing protein [Jeotgalibaca ciconiae]|uniref:Phosphate ABC transporter substrate-binding protein n=1 Tax=Jeotgalibaca ciconiae TaxID=2496265 RepID=A0A3S9HB30_9LACT|nr:substrate-binding domain-containing protein [Jeotgalibaca ciconiae]AZP04592.1 phosphate ABC transporter substrate-binding protein [Jeotgalibaca ciconiae]
MQLKSLSKLVLSIGAVGVLAACDPAATGGDETGTGAVSGTINVVSREDGSGTRGAFTEITGVLEDDVDNTYVEAVIQNGTEGVISTVSQDTNGIGYISLGSLNDNVKGVAIDGVEPTAETVQNGSFPIARNFNIAWSGDLEAVAQDFVDFILSEEGQTIALGEGYVESVSDAPAYEGDGTQSGTIAVVGSTSVTPLMEVLSEEYRALNPDVQIDITSNGSSAGMTSAIDGTADIGMASRELKDEENAELNSEAIAIDGIAVVVNKGNGIEGLTLEQVKQIFTGEITEWEDVQ